jgi:site-specific DNA-methyltransferase (adenine-specific)
MTKLNRGLFTSLRGDWKTPKALYQALDAEFHFDFDPYPTKLIYDGLEIGWGSVNFANPPYGKEISRWIQKGYHEFLKGKTVVFLLPSRTDTRWWHDCIMHATEIRFIRGRLKFDDQKNPAPFPSAVAVFKPKKYGKPNRQER